MLHPPPFTHADWLRQQPPCPSEHLALLMGDDPCDDWAKPAPQIIVTEPDGSRWLSLDTERDYSYLDGT